LACLASGVHEVKRAFRAGLDRETEHKRTERGE
jgi:hypothetical protein